MGKARFTHGILLGADFVAVARKLIVFGGTHRRLLHGKETPKSRMAVTSFPIKKKIIKLLLAAFNNFVQLQLQLLED